MKFLFDFFYFISFLNKASHLGLIYFAYTKSNRLSLLFLSLVFAPFSTISFALKIKNQINIADIFQKLGPVFIKFGQTVSTRADIVGEEIASALSKLQDRLEAFDSNVAIDILENDLLFTKEVIFSEFDTIPVAAASIAQVHKAKLKNGTQVAVKILRPKIIETYNRDINLLFLLAKFANKFILKAKRLKLVEAVKIFQKTMRFELDLKNEAAAATELAFNLKNDKEAYIPKVYWDYCSEKVLVTEWIDGISIYDNKSIDENNLNIKDIIKNLAISFLNQAFRDGFFHADLHPGNIIVLKDGRIAFIDFGIMGQLTDRDRLALAEVLLCQFTKNFKRIAEIHKEIGFIPQDTNVIDFALACRAVTEPIIDKPIDKISIGHLLESLFKITEEFGMETQPQLIMLQKTIVVVEGIGKTLAPEVNMWQLAEPWVKNWAGKNLGFDAKIIKAIKVGITEMEKKIMSFIRSN